MPLLFFLGNEIQSSGRQGMLSLHPPPSPGSPQTLLPHAHPPHPCHLGPEGGEGKSLFL